MSDTTAPPLPLSEAPAAPPPTRLGGYTIVEELGRGGMGMVYLARQDSLGRLVAIKVLRAELAKDPICLERFQREARAAALFQHPHVVSIIDTGFDATADAHYIAFEYIDGGSLEGLIKGAGKLGERRSLEITRAIANALAFAESKGMVHRDLKPANILIGSDGTPKLADLGLARHIDASTPAVTQEGIILGTPLYMAPEQALGRGQLDVRADIYSLGLVLFRMLSGRVPFNEAEDTCSTLAILSRHVNEPLQDVRAYAAEVSAGTVQLLADMSAREVEERYRSAVHLVEDVDRLLAGKEPLGARARLSAAPGAGEAATTALSADTVRALQTSAAAAAARQAQDEAPTIRVAPVVPAPPTEPPAPAQPEPPKPPAPRPSDRLSPPVVAPPGSARFATPAKAPAAAGHAAPVALGAPPPIVVAAPAPVVAPPSWALAVVRALALVSVGLALAAISARLPWDRLTGAAVPPATVAESPSSTEAPAPATEPVATETAATEPPPPAPTEDAPTEAAPPIEAATPEPATEPLPDVDDVRLAIEAAAGDPAALARLVRTIGRELAVDVPHGLEHIELLAARSGWGDDVERRRWVAGMGPVMHCLDLRPLAWPDREQRLDAVTEATRTREPVAPDAVVARAVDAELQAWFALADALRRVRRALGDPRTEEQALAAFARLPGDRRALQDQARRLFALTAASDQPTRWQRLPERRVELRLDAREAHRPGTALEVVLGQEVTLVSEVLARQVDDADASLASALVAVRAARPGEARHSAYLAARLQEVPPDTARSSLVGYGLVLEVAQPLSSQATIVVTLDEQLSVSIGGGAVVVAGTHRPARLGDATTIIVEPRLDALLVRIPGAEPELFRVQTKERPLQAVRFAVRAGGVSIARTWVVKVPDRASAPPPRDPRRIR